jgi:hypothetical protein
VETDIEMLPVRSCRKLLMAADEEQLQEDAPNSTFLEDRNTSASDRKSKRMPEGS